MNTNPEVTDFTQITPHPVQQESRTNRLSESVTGQPDQQTVSELSILTDRSEEICFIRSCN